MLWTYLVQLVLYNGTFRVLSNYFTYRINIFFDRYEWILYSWNNWITRPLFFPLYLHVDTTNPISILKKNSSLGLEPKIYMSLKPEVSMQLYTIYTGWKHQFSNRGSFPFLKNQTKFSTVHYWLYFLENPHTHFFGTPLQNWNIARIDNANWK